jgi:hypothetical protein
MMAEIPLTTTSHSRFVLQKTIVLPALEYVVMRSTTRRRFAWTLGGTRHPKHVISSFIFPAQHCNALDSVHKQRARAIAANDIDEACECKKIEDEQKMNIKAAS